MDPQWFELSVQIDALYHGTNRFISAGLARRGYGDVRAAHGVVFELVGDGARATDMATRAGVTKQAIGQLVHHLEVAGYVTALPDPTDARARIVCLTERGQRAAAAAREVLSELHTRWTELIPARDRDKVVAALTELASSTQPA
jgi:DNA-binding MarR family transcriptional regulator